MKCRFRDGGTAYVDVDVRTKEGAIWKKQITLRTMSEIRDRIDVTAVLTMSQAKALGTRLLRLANQLAQQNGKAD